MPTSPSWALQAGQQAIEQVMKASRAGSLQPPNQPVLVFKKKTALEDKNGKDQRVQVH